jgi:structural maintenance of chromosome 1
MDIDDDEDGTQKPKTVADYGIEVNFESIDDDDRIQDPAEMIAQFDKEIASANNDIERMAPNMKAVERFASFPFLLRFWESQFQTMFTPFFVVLCRLDDVEAKLAMTEKEADKARKESKTARDYYNEVKTKR